MAPTWKFQKALTMVWERINLLLWHNVKNYTFFPHYDQVKKIVNIKSVNIKFQSEFSGY